MTEKIYFHIDNQNFLPVGVKFENINNIDKYTDNSIEYILIQDLLDYYYKDDAGNVLSLLKNKLKDGGMISIQSIDIKQFCISVCFDEISEDLAKDILYPNKKSIRSLNDVQNLLKNLGFEIQIKKYINIFEYYLLAKKI